MLLPSDVARLVLGYLQQENLQATCHQFILESSDLKEYAEHCTEDGFIPACLLSLCGKNLTTILNEYVAMKTKETTNEVPAMMSSLWKKLDYTLSQIRSMQNSDFRFSSNQRIRTRSGIVEMKRQRMLQQSAPPNSGLLSVAQQSGPQNSSSVVPPQVIHRPTINQSIPQTRLNTLFVNQSQTQENKINRGLIHIQVPTSQERKLHSNLLSPGRRKSESQKRKSTATSGPLSATRSTQDSEEAVVEKESEPLEELIDGNFPVSICLQKQLVIENAREKILSNKSLQEKLAENINKILGSDGSVAQAPKQTDSGPTEQETSIDEILGLQGEIHMSEEAIQDILEQTESDPAFQALFDWFDYGKSKVNKNLPAGISGRNGVENEILVGEDSLETFGSSLGTEETNRCDNSREPLSCKGFELGEASCALKTSINDDDMVKKNPENPASEQLDANCGPRKQTEELTAITPEHIRELEIAFDSVSGLTEPNKGPSSDSKCNEHCADTYVTKESSALVSESESAMEIEKGPPSDTSQSSPSLEYVHSSTPQIPLISVAEDTIASENKTDSGSKCSLSPNRSLSEKGLSGSPSDGSPGHSALLRQNNSSIPSPSADAGKEQAATSDPAALPGVSQEISSHPSDHQDQSTQADCAVGSAVDITGLDKTELQLEVVDTSNKTYSNDQRTLDEPCKKDFNLPSGLSNTEGTQEEIQEPLSSTKVDADNLYFSSGDNACTDISVVSTENNLTTSEICHSPLPETTPSTDESGTEAKSITSVSSSSQPMDVDPSNIMSLKIIISDDPFIASDTELNNAVSSITGENLPTIILSSPAKSPTKTAGLPKCLTSEDTEKNVDSAVAEQNLLVLRPKDPVVTSVNTQNEDCTGFSAAGSTHLSSEGGFIQLMPATSTAFGNSSNLYIATCMTDPATLGAAVTPSNVVVLPGSSMPLASQAPAVQQLRTPPRSSNTFPATQTVSPNFPQGSAIIIASPVQPVLQGMVGMIPLSVVGQNGNTFSAPACQVLHMPVANPVCNGSVPKLPIPPKSQKIPGARNKTNTGACLAFLRGTEEKQRVLRTRKLLPNVAEPLNHANPRTQRTGNWDKLTSAEPGKKVEENVSVAPAESTSSNSRQSESHRRVLCFDNFLPTPGGNTQIQATKSSSQKERNENPLFAVDAASSSAKAQVPKRDKDKTLPRILCRPEVGSNRGASAKEPQSERKVAATGLSSDPFHKTTANKENELRRDTDEKQKNQDTAKLSNGQQSVALWTEKTVPSVQELNKKQGSLSNGAGSGKSSVSVPLSSKEAKREPAKAPSQGLGLPSPFSKQHVEMMQDMQWQSPAGKAAENGELPVPRTPSGVGDRHADDTADSIRTPTCRRFPEESGTPRVMVPPATPDLPACSPASETGSENSVSMAAHTLMILSRAAIARTSAATPLKDNTQQFRALRSTVKKRKLEDLSEGERNSRSASRKDLQSSPTPSKKKKIKKKKLPNSFPAGMDVDKFLLSLHYDE
ncbi:protein NPAT isoform X2 [Oenanthe melanoleuca]|uniref:protein NPAT isoform X2 n=1 Tax=Oenanthe melanoleuca TaxID=2939378 RepID=UPI0024C16167|nr:protein NPAT isoform X2 [Oenanthe melanoleuca]